MTCTFLFKLEVEFFQMKKKPPVGTVVLGVYFDVWSGEPHPNLVVVRFEGDYFVDLVSGLRYRHSFIRGWAALPHLIQVPAQECLPDIRLAV